MSHKKLVSRRRVLQAGAAAAVCSPYFFTSSSAKAESANDKINVAAIGVGDRGTVIGKEAAAAANMLACADVKGGNAKKFAAEVGGKCDVYKDYRKILDRNDIAAVVCGTPDHWHTIIAVDAMRAGKDVYCEKPLTLTMAESKLICRVTKETGRVFQVGTQQRSEFGQKFLRAVALARSGRLGKKLHAISSVEGAETGGPFPPQQPPADLDWDFWLGQAPKVEFTPNRIGWDFRWWLEYSGGQVTDWGVHHTDIAIWALGGEELGAIEAEGHGDFPGLPADVDIFAFLNGKQTIPPCHNVAAAFDCNLTLANGNTINLVSKKNELIICGEKGKIRVNRGGLTGKPIEELTEADHEWLDKEIVKLCKGKRPAGHMRNFFDCVKDRSEPISDVYTHCNSVNACHMANIAMLLRRKVKFDPKKYRFVADEEADRLMSRRQRTPYECV